MSVLWCGGEDIDFPNGVAVIADTTTTDFRAAYARVAIGISGTGVAKSTVFPGGAVTSCWFSCRIAVGTVGVCTKGVGLGLSGTNSGLFLGTDTTNSAKLALCKYDGTTTTQLASEAGTSIGSAMLHLVRRIDMQLVNYGASATVNVFLDGTLAIAFSGDVAVSGVTSLDSVFSVGPGGVVEWVFSEVIVADEDTRAWPGLATMAPTANGTTLNWSNSTFSNFSSVAINDANSTFVNTTAQDEQANLTDLTAGTFLIKAVKVAARAMHTSGSTASAVSLGVNNGGTIGVASSHALTTAFATYEDLFANDPTTSSAWLQSAMNALQLNLRSA